MHFSFWVSHLFSRDYVWQLLEKIRKYSERFYLYCFRVFHPKLQNNRILFFQGVRIPFFRQRVCGSSAHAREIWGIIFSFEVLSLVTQIVPELYHRVFPAKIFINSLMVKNQIKSFLLIRKHKSEFYNHQFVVQGLSAAPLFSQHAPSFSLGQLQAPCYGFFLVSDTFRLIVYEL